MTPIPRDAHEWLSFEDTKRERTWMFDVTFLESNWTCIFGNGCQGVLTGASPELVQGCCSYGAHFTDAKDQRRVEKAATRLTDDQWQFKAKGKNRPDFHRGPGCALHVMAIDNKESYIPLKPEVCWQLPLRRDDEVQDDGHVITRISQWDRRDWGPGGAEFHWWCTESASAFVGKTRVVDSMHDELVAMVGESVYGRLRATQPKATRLAHPVVRRKS